ncbi:hypothetical protein [Nostoc sp. 'Lobaria pulmonaria (5183) cyanobiont']|uniref:hypothetical protein n=1 Tax=Nostoc sp. 'Lobaria pulmonaria (5183) cyanobiont' TaxID=1618022 RepID=UPI001F23A801|nr:hypothetical protein [Nostoc sp. 'Lobaria pulmonaria (5183) cyanobiont']
MVKCFLYRILIVDDREDNCDLLRQLFNTIGFETLTAANGQEAIALTGYGKTISWKRLPVLY